jgi:SAM-dependent methyltransferase
VVALVGCPDTGSVTFTASSPEATCANEIYEKVQAYYEAKLVLHGANPRGVDWSCAATQWLRFVQLLKICPLDTSFSLIDLGCGYGALAAFLADRYPQTDVEYLGIDVSPVMIRRARRRFRGDPKIRFRVGRNCLENTDYTVASGIMNIRLGVSITQWESLIRATLTDMRNKSRKGFAVNFLATPPRCTPPEMTYCALSSKWARFCQEELGCATEVREAYGLGEYTLLARR